MTPAERDAARQAIAALRPVIVAAALEGGPPLADGLAELARALGALDRLALASAAHAAARSVDDAAALRALGQRLHDEALPDLAIAILSRGFRLAPGEAAAIALAAALGASGHHAEACAVLRAAGAERSGLAARGLLALHAILAGDLTIARGVLPALASEPAHRALAGTIAAMLARADAIAGVSPLDAGDLRGWHFVTTGGLLLHRARHGLDHGMNGRYAFVQDGPADCLEGLRRLAAVLAAWRQPVERVIAPDERASRILAIAAAKVLGCTVGSLDAPAGLVVVYDLDRLGEADRAALRIADPARPLYAHSAVWTEEHPVAADLVVRLCQFYRAPWDARTGVDPATGAPCAIPADDASEAELAAQIAGAPLAADALDDLPVVLALAGVVHPAATGERSRAWAGSPVPSLRFT